MDVLGVVLALLRDEVLRVVIVLLEVPEPGLVIADSVLALDRNKVVLVIYLVKVVIVVELAAVDAILFI